MVSSCRRILPWSFTCVKGIHTKKNYPAAIAAYRKSLKLQRSLFTESENVAIVLNNLASAEKDSGNLAAAERIYREALRIARAVGYTEGVAAYMGNLAALALDRKDWPGAETLAREALALSEKLGRQELTALECHHLALALVRQGKPAKALPHGQRAVEIYTRLGHPDLKAARATLRECEA